MMPCCNDAKTGFQRGHYLSADEHWHDTQGLEKRAEADGYGREYDLIPLQSETMWFQFAVPGHSDNASSTWSGGDWKPGAHSPLPGRRLRTQPLYPG